MDILAKRRLTGDYGTINEGDTATVKDETGQLYLDEGWAEKATKVNPTATPEQVMTRNVDGVTVDAVHVDATNREILNTDGRKLHESGPDATIEAAARVEAEVTPDLDNVPVSKGDGESTEKKEKESTARKTKEDKAAGAAQTK